MTDLAKPKSKREPSAYAKFIKEHYNDDDVKAIKNSKDKIKLLAQKWKKSKEVKTN